MLEPARMTAVEASGPECAGFGWETGLKKLTFTPCRSIARTMPRLTEVTPTPEPIGISMIVRATGVSPKLKYSWLIKKGCLGQPCYCTWSESGFHQFQRVVGNYPLLVGRDHHGDGAAGFGDDALTAETGFQVGFGVDLETEQ